MNKPIILIVVMYLTLSCLFFCGCEESQSKALAVSESQVKLRSMQSRIFDTSDKIKTLRTAMATLQDLGFVIDKADDVLGSVSATKLDRYAVRITINVRPNGETQMLVRANAQYNLKAIEDPEPYQQFFAAFEKAMFLTANDISGASGAGVPAFGTPKKEAEVNPAGQIEIHNENITSTGLPKITDKQSSSSTQAKGAMSSGLTCTICRRVRGEGTKWTFMNGKLRCLDCSTKLESSKKAAKKTGSIVH